jgi:hypothetical protein
VHSGNEENVMPAAELIKKYCTDRRGTHPGEIPPPISIDKMENHRTEAFIDGDAFFSAIRVEISDLIVELSVSILEPETTVDELPTTLAEEANPANYNKKAPSFVQRFRRDLWAHYFGISLDPAKRSNDDNEVYTGLLSLRHALSPWNPARWRVTISRIKFPSGLRPEISRQNLTPFPSSGKFEEKDYDRMDPDSRKSF